MVRGSHFQRVIAFLPIHNSSSSSTVPNKELPVDTALYTLVDTTLQCYRVHVEHISTNVVDQTNQLIGTTFKIKTQENYSH